MAADSTLKCKVINCILMSGVRGYYDDEHLITLYDLHTATLRASLSVFYVKLERDRERERERESTKKKTEKKVECMSNVTLNTAAELTGTFHTASLTARANHTAVDVLRPYYVFTIQI
jgi:hypothetical protein